MTAHISAQSQSLIALGRAVRARLRAGRQTQRDWADPSHEASSDLQYGIDRFSEERLIEAVTEHCAALLPVLLRSEGLPAEGVLVGTGAPHWLLMLDPVDGTRGLMHDKRSAFFLAGLAPVHDARLATLQHAAMVELPTTRSDLSDVLAADADGALHAATDHLSTGESTMLPVHPSRATDLQHGFATVVRYFAGASELLGRFHDALLADLTARDPHACQNAFEDQYISSGGQMHALMTGRDRFVADLRPLAATASGVPLRCSQPYDLLALLIAKAAGVEITDAHGAPLDAPLDLSTRVAWIGYANPQLRTTCEPAVQRALHLSGLLP